MAEDIPPAIHKKLVCVAKRGRFSHVVPPRVWQAPNGRVIQILDDAEAPLDEEFYKALVELEKKEEERAKEVEQQGTVVNVNTYVVEDEHIKSDRISATPPEEDKAAQSASSNDSTVAELMPSQSKNTTSKGKKPIKSLMVWLKQTNGDDEEENSHQTEVTARSEMHKLINGISSTRPATALTAMPSLVPKSTISTAAATAGSVTPQDKPVNYNAAHCLIHKWNPVVRSRCFVYPTASHSTTMSPSPTQPECLLWIRFGCVRLDYNLALQQALWVRMNIPNCRVCAIAFIPSSKASTECADVRALSSALAETTRKLAAIGIECFIFDHEEETTASPLFALWTRQRDVIGIFTTENYQRASTKVSEAVSRSVRCAVFGFDAENIVPVRFLEAKFSDSAMDVAMEEFAQVMMESLKSLREKRDVLFHFIGQASRLPNSGMQVPDLILRRFTRFTPEQLPSLEGTLWTESRVQQLSLKILDNGEDGNLLSHVRLGTLSPLAILLQTETLPETLVNVLLERIYRIFQDWFVSTRSGKNGSPGKAEISPPTTLNQHIVDVFESSVSDASDHRDEWKRIAQRLRVEQTLSNADLRCFWQKGYERWGATGGDTLRVLLRKYFVGFGASDVCHLLRLPS